jgi:two-component system LytT family response regulator
MARARRHVGDASSGELARSLAALVDRVESRAKPVADGCLQRMLVSSGNRSVSLRVTDVLWVEADDYYARLHTVSESFLVRQSLSSLEGQLDPARFVRVHRGAIVNIDRVRELTRGERGQVDLRLEEAVGSASASVAATRCSCASAEPPQIADAIVLEYAAWRSLTCRGAYCTEAAFAA